MKRLITILFFIFSFFLQNAFCAANFKIRDIVFDNSDKTILIKGEGSFLDAKTNVYNPVALSQNVQNNSLNFINNLTTFSITNPTRYVIDIPNSILMGPSRSYKIKNSKVLQKIDLAQNSINPHVVRVTFTLFYNADLVKFKTLSDGQNIIIRYNDKIVNNSIQHKFYTPTGDMDKNAISQNTQAELTYNNSENIIEIDPKLKNKYYLTQINQNSEGILIKGIGEISQQRVIYSENDTKAELILDNAGLLEKFENKSYIIPNSNKDIKATLTINQLNSKKVKLTILGENLKDYRFVTSPDGQSLFISHRNYVLNTNFSITPSKINSYKLTKNSNGYYIFDLALDNPVAYDVFELNNMFYLDISNVSDINLNLFNEAIKNSDLKIKAMKISADKTRYIINSENVNFSYANIESNSKSIKLCFKEKPKEITKPDDAIISNNTTTPTNPIKNTTNTTSNNSKLDENIITLDTVNNAISTYQPYYPAVKTIGAKPINKPSELQRIENKPTTNNRPAEIQKTETKPTVSNKPAEIQKTETKNPKIENKNDIANVIYVPKETTPKVIYKEPSKKKKDTTTISSLKKVVIDPGHGGTDSGAVGGNNIYEKNLNLEVSKLIQQKLQKKNIKVYMTRIKDASLSLEERVEFANEINPDIYVSIHTNSTVQNVTYGLETHYFKDDSVELAEIIHKNFASEANLKKWDTKNRGVIKSRFYVINHTEVPSVLIEMGFISNEAERTKLTTKQRQEEIANSIVAGILEYLKVK